MLVTSGNVTAVHGGTTMNKSISRYYVRGDSVRVCRVCRTKKPLQDFAYGQTCKDCSVSINQQRFIAKVFRNIPTKKEVLDRKTAARRRRVLESEGSVTNREWFDLKAKYNFTCLCCGRREPKISLTKDHVIPLALGGRGSIDNIQPLCLPCNSSKHKKIVDYRPK